MVQDGKKGATECDLEQGALVPVWKHFVLEYPKTVCTGSNDEEFLRGP